MAPGVWVYGIFPRRSKPIINTIGRCIMTDNNKNFIDAKFDLTKIKLRTTKNNIAEWYVEETVKETKKSSD